MSTMKKLFALTLALAMLMSVTAFAADFTDKAEIEDSCEGDIALLTALGIVEGNADGTFGPKNTIKRSEAAAIIYRLRNGGKDDKAEAWKGASSFTDVAKDIWYSGYVAYCEYYGIIDGKSATIFDPNAPVTTAEFAKMLLTVANYKSSVEGYTGSNWSKNVLTDAEAAGIFENFGGSYAGACSREWACKLMVNTIVKVDMAAYLGDYRYPVKAEDAVKVGEKYLNLVQEITYVVANDEWSFNLNIANADKDQIKVSATGINGLATEDDVTVVEYDLPAELVGQQVVIAKNSKTGEIYGISATGKTNYGVLEMSRTGSSGTAGNANEYKHTWKVNGVTYLNAKLQQDVGSSAKIKALQGGADDYEQYIYNCYYVDSSNNNKESVVTHTLNPNVLYEHQTNRGAEDFTIMAWDCDGDGDLDRTAVIPAFYGVVATEIEKDTKTIEVSITRGYNKSNKFATSTSNIQFTLKDIDVNGTLAKDAVVKVEWMHGKYTLTVLDAVVGKLDKLTGASSSLSLYVAGTAYKVPNKSSYFGAYAINYPTSTDLLGKVVKFYITTNGRILTTPVEYAENVTVSYKMAYLIAKDTVEVAGEADEWGNPGTPTDVNKVKVMYTDGTSEILVYDDDSALTGAAAFTDLATEKVYEFAVNDGKIVLFTKLSENENMIYGAESAVGAVDAASLDNAVTLNLAKKRFGDVLIDDNTVIFVKYLNDKGESVYTVMKLSAFKSQVNGKEFQLIARSKADLSFALVASVAFDSALPGNTVGSYLLYAQGSADRYNIGEDENGAPINIGKFEAVDLYTGVAGVYVFEDASLTIAKNDIIYGTFNANGNIDVAPTKVTISEFADSLAASSWLKGKVVAVGEGLFKLDNTLIDKDNLTDDCVVLAKSGTSFIVSDFSEITVVAKDKDNNLVLHVDDYGKIDMILYTVDGNAF